MDTPVKRCSKCGEEFPATLEYFYKGSCNKCKKCCDEYNKGWRSKNYERSRKNQREYKAKHREHFNALGREWAKRHPQYSREWQKKNPDKVRRTKRKNYTKHQTQQCEYARHWRQTHPLAVKAQKHNARTRKRSLPTTVTAEQWQACLDYWHNCCVYCGNPSGLLPAFQISRDHFIPLNARDCPGDVPGNIIPACRSCNSSKKQRDPIDWLTREFGKRKAAQILKRINAYFDWLKTQK